MAFDDKATKVALITGANRGIGLEIARQLARLGYVALIGSRDGQRGEQAAEVLRSEGLQCQSLALDVTAQASIDAAAAAIKREFGKLDALVNNAAIAEDNAPPGELEMAVLRKTYETNVFGLFAVTKAMLPLLRNAEAGRIVNLTSGSGSLTRTSAPEWRPEWNGLAYNTSKSAVNAITVVFANELRPTRIKINAVNPGFTATEMSPSAVRTAAHAAVTVVRFATLPDDGPSGGYFDENGVVPW